MKIRNLFKSNKESDTKKPSNLLYDYKIHLQNETVEIEQADLFTNENCYDISSPTKEKRLVIPKAEVKYIEETNCIEETATSLNNLVRVRAVLDLADKHNTLNEFKQELKQHLSIKGNDNEN